MKYDYYKKVNIYKDFEIYDFISSGAKGDIAKRVRFDLIEDPNVYNLAFGNLIENGRIDDYSISDNNDMPKILATIAFIAEVFLEEYPDRTILSGAVPLNGPGFTGWRSGNNLNELRESFEIYGVHRDGNISFFTKDREYLAFLVRKKL